MADAGQLSIEQRKGEIFIISNKIWCAFYMNVKRRNIYIYMYTVQARLLCFLKSVFERSCSVKVLTH